MQSQKDEPGSVSQKDDDIQFDRDNITSTDSQSPSPEQPTPSSPENVILPKEDLLHQPEVTPLSEEEKQPKLADEERIQEMNRKTSLGD